MGGAGVTASSVSGDGGGLVASPPPVAGGILVAPPPPVAAGGSSRSLLGRRFPQEVWRRGEPCLRPETGHVLLARTPSMDELEARYRGHVLLATAVGDGSDAVTPAALLAAMEEKCGVLPSDVGIEVACPPHDLWLYFSSTDKCTSVLESSMKFKCSGRWIRFGRWTRAARATEGSLDFKTKLSFEGLPDTAWSTEAVQGVLKELGGDLIEVIPPDNRRELEVMAWLRNPSSVGKVVKVEIPEPKVVWRDVPQSYEDLETPEYGPSSPRRKRTMIYPVFVHVKEVVDRGPRLCSEPMEYSEPM